ncbi:MAG: DUF3500 domain-containing protein [Pirellulaceae bacterium]
MRECSDCVGVNRRDFLKAGAVAGAAVAGGVLLDGPIRAADEKKKPADGETLAQQLYGTLTDKQKSAMCFSFEDPLRQKVDNNWRITNAAVSTFEPDQQALIREIFLSLHSPEYAEKVMQQVTHDNGKGGFGRCAIAMFGEPGGGKFEFVLTGRHVTRRCDGDAVEGAAFGGPIFYGHQGQDAFNEKADHPDNIYWYQALRANELFQALDGKQRKIALRSDPRKEAETATVKLSGSAEGLGGIAMGDLSSDQKTLAKQIMTDVLAPFRKRDVAESMKMIEKQGLDNLHISYFENLDVGNDGVWDVWQVEGPTMVWYFRGHPHVHTWVHIRDSV